MEEKKGGSIRRNGAAHKICGCDPAEKTGQRLQPRGQRRARAGGGPTNNVHISWA